MLTEPQAVQFARVARRDIARRSLPRGIDRDDVLGMAFLRACRAPDYDAARGPFDRWARQYAMAGSVRRPDGLRTVGRTAKAP